MEILFRIDDFGLSPGVNRGIKHSIDFGLTKNVGIIVNLSDSLEALKFAKLKNDVCFGLHVNLVLGEPCSKTYQSSSLICPEKNIFISSGIRRKQISGGRDLFNYKETYKEVNAQLDKFIDVTGKIPDYIDQHAIHTSTTNEVIKRIAIERHIPYYEDLNNENIFFHPISVELEKKSFSQIFDSDKLSFDKVNHFIFHPGYVDIALLMSSSLTYRRLLDLKFLNSENTKRKLKEKNAVIVDFLDLANNQS
ncbi:hypothetical protein NRIC_38140 [Enterococcus florum]|uniref:ChbG/HpnK family deacetylase n=1 Tax=Enterococcus florum TaxID=2480627 RepID=A0A4P5PU13_9ENTE|nr:ChbG/HpnK family deacetylase [Enterococcus florum]GCF95923.1 hypothetical protein NRIC_38140 [Enterococcus florum]